MTQTQANQDTARRDLLRWVKWLFALLPLAGVLFLVALIFYVITFSGGLSANPEAWGQFGDYLGGVLNPAFAFLSLIALLATLYVQSHELRVSVDELRASTEALKSQNDVLAHQSFDNTFFQMLRRFEEVVASTSSGPFQGLLAFREYRSRLTNIYNQSVRVAVAQTSTDKAVAAYEEFYANYRHDLGHYFRTLYHIFRFVDESPLSDYEKARYANIARAQLSTYQLTLLFYNGVTGEGKEGFKPLVEKYGILKHVNANDLCAPSDKDNRDFYAEQAFLSREGRERLGVHG